LGFSPTAGLSGANTFVSLAELSSGFEITLGFSRLCGLTATRLETIDNFSLHLLPDQFFNLRKLLPVSRADQ
jgi:hypothetical protein